MKSDFKWPVMVLIILLTFAGIYAFSYWRQLNLVEEPLRDKLLELENIADVNIYSSTPKVTINIVLDKGDNLPQLYNNVEEVALSIYEEDSFNISITDKRTPYLNNLYEEIHFSLMEGERLGNYSKMKEEISHILGQEQNLDSYHLWVDQKRIYLLLTSGDSFLCEITPISSYQTRIKL
ncbi:MAG: hypothetical protein ACOX6X_07170 [Dethiobacteria bacterium]